MKIRVQYATVAQIRPKRCEMCYEPNAVTIVSICLRFANTSVSKDVDVACCESCSKRFWDELEAHIKTQDAEDEIR